MEARRAGVWALVFCPLVAWLSMWWASDVIRPSNLRVLWFFIVVPALLAAAGKVAAGEHGRAVAHASFWAVMVTLGLIIPVAVVGMLIDFPFS